MRVLHVISDSNVGGAGVLLTSLLRHFDTSRVQSVVALPRDSALIERIAPLGVPIRLLQYRADRPTLQSVNEIARLISLDRIDVVHANAAINARIAGRRCHRAVVHTRHCCYAPSGMMKARAIRRLAGYCNNALSDLAVATADERASGNGVIFNGNVNFAGANAASLVNDFLHFVCPFRSVNRSSKICFFTLLCADLSS